MNDTESAEALLSFLLRVETIESPQALMSELIALAGKTCGANPVVALSADGMRVSHGLGGTATAYEDSLGRPPTPEEWRERWGKRAFVVEVDSEMTLLLALPAPPDVACADQFAQVVREAAQSWKAYNSRKIRQRWGPSTRELIQALVSEIEEEEALDLATRLALIGGDADICLLYLPFLEGRWACEFAVGDGSGPFLGTPFTGTARTEASLRRQRGTCSPRVEELLDDKLNLLAGIGPALVVPLGSSAGTEGTLVLLRRQGRPRFSRENIPLAEAFGAATTLAIEVARGRRAEANALMFAERERIARDLHDLGIQLLFASGIQLDKLQSDIDEGRYSHRKIATEIRQVMSNLEEAVRQIRSVVRGLQESEEKLSLVEALQQEASRSRRALGFAPSLLLVLDGAVINPDSADAARKLGVFAERVDDELGSDAVAVVREALSNVARHAGARSTKIEVSLNGKHPTGELLLSVIDDGRGVSITRTRNSGIANMGKRAAQRGGSFAIGLGPRQRGTAVVWRAPL